MLRISLSNSKTALRVRLCWDRAHSCGPGCLAHLLEAQRGDDPVDVGFLGDDQLAVDPAGRLNQEHSW